MALRCPVCKAENSSPPTCRRCKVDLSTLFALENRREYLLSLVGRQIADQRYLEALSSAEQADQLRSDENSMKLVALSALLGGDHVRAWNGYRRIKDRSGPGESA